MTLAVTTFASAAACNDPSSEQYCADIETMADCERAEGCGWSADYDECVNTCAEITVQAECEAIDRCFWYPDGQPDGGSGDTGGDPDAPVGTCGEPFT